MVQVLPPQPFREATPLKVAIYGHKWFPGDEPKETYPLPFRRERMKRVLVLLMMLLNIGACHATSNSASVEFSIVIPAFLNITPLTNTTLIAHVQNGVVTNPLRVKYRVVSNIPETTLYLTSKSMVDGGLEHSMFECGGRVYIAFSSVFHPASYQNLNEAKINLKAPNVLILPINNISGAESKFKYDKYEIYIKNGTYYIDVNVGMAPPVRANVNGMYQATLYLTETEI